MAYVEEYDPTKPPSTEAVGSGDDRIRELKRAITERLLQFFPGWPNTDPLVIDQTKLYTVVTSLAVPTGVASTFFNVPINIDAVYLVCAVLINQAATEEAVAYAGTSQNGTVSLFGHTAPGGSVVTITNVAGAIKVTHTAGANRDVKATLRRIL
jgi:hypothetical protein